MTSAMVDVKWSRAWAMPSRHTFSIAPIAELLKRYMTGSELSIDPFCGDSKLATLRNDLATGVDAEEYCRTLLKARGPGWADVILFDPPYSPRQVSECYKSVGLAVTEKETQNGHLYKRVREALKLLLRHKGIAISFGWNSAGFGYDPIEIMLVAHGGAHNDTIVLVEQK